MPPHPASLPVPSMPRQASCTSLPHRPPFSWLLFLASTPASSLSCLSSPFWCHPPSCHSCFFVLFVLLVFPVFLGGNLVFLGGNLVFLGGNLATALRVFLGGNLATALPPPVDTGSHRCKEALARASGNLCVSHTKATLSRDANPYVFLSASLNQETGVIAETCV